MAQLRTIKDRIIFQFLEDTTGGSFANRTDWGFEIKSPTTDLKAARWATVTHIGNKVKDIVEGDFVLIEPLMWTLHMEVEGKKYWTTTEEKVMILSKERPKGFS